MEKSKTKEQALEAIGLDSFHDLTPEKMVGFLHESMDMPEEELRASIAEIPDFAKLTEGTLDLLKSIGEKALAGNSDSMNKFYEHCGIVHQALADAAKATTSMDEKMMIFNMMKEIVCMEKDKDTENKLYHAFLVGAGVVGVGIAGYVLHKAGILDLIGDEIA